MKTIISLPNHHSFVATIIRHTSTGYYVIWNSSKDEMGNSVGEWISAKWCSIPY